MEDDYGWLARQLRQREHERDEALSKLKEAELRIADLTVDSLRKDVAIGQLTAALAMARAVIDRASWEQERHALLGRVDILEKAARTVTTQASPLNYARVPYMPRPAAPATATPHHSTPSPKDAPYPAATREFKCATLMASMAAAAPPPRVVPVATVAASVATVAGPATVPAASAPLPKAASAMHSARSLVTADTPHLVMGPPLPEAVSSHAKKVVKYVPAAAQSPPPRATPITTAPATVPTAPKVRERVVTISTKVPLPARNNVRYNITGRGERGSIIGKVIGHGGETIKRIEKESGCCMGVHRPDSDAPYVFIECTNFASQVEGRLQKAVRLVHEVIAQPASRTPSHCAPARSAPVPSPTVQCAAATLASCSSGQSAAANRADSCTSTISSTLLMSSCEEPTAVPSCSPPSFGTKSMPVPSDK